MDGTNIAEYGVVGVALAAIVYIVRSFLSHIKEKDDKFTQVISNHIDHSTAASTRLSDKMEQLAEAIDKLMSKI